MSRKAIENQALYDLDEFSVARRVNLTKHAKQRCKERGVRPEDALSQKPKQAKPIVVGEKIVTVVNKNHGNHKLNKNGELTHLTKVKLPKEKEHLVGRIIGKGGENIKKIKVLVKDSTITYKDDDRSFHIWSTCTTSGEYECISMDENQTIDDTFLLELERKEKVGIVVYMGKAYVIGRRKGVDSVISHLQKHFKVNDLLS
ncbi:hypothetical protein HK103_004432 [Boothiomyces macroporosus]|uniref:K Homology domain-containing protein n=1 Tax=Boothiomyces macroporosus TaxID=261099 RepID=A0AAD5U8J8_9FUNG|nr:hypothetical protein HK103_004432 [Boothiomyces macroporosus]